MRDGVSWCVELAIRPGQLDNFKTLTGAMVDAARNEVGVLSYQRFAAADGRTVYVYEQYENSDAALAHLELFAEKFGRRFESMVDRKRFTVYGRPSARLKKFLDTFGAAYLAPFGDFDYWP